MNRIYKTELVKGVYLPAVQSLRGFAALAVVFFHFTKMLGQDLPTEFAFIERDFRFGVQLFFVISALSLCYSTTNQINNPNWINNYFIKRLFRIAPLFYLMLTFEILRQFFTNGAVTSSLSSIFLNLTFTFGFAPPSSSIVWAGWTIGVEMIFYLIFPILLMTINKYSTALIFLISTILVSCFIRYELFNSMQNLPALDRSLNLRLAFASNICFFAMGFYAYHVIKIIKNNWPIFHIKLVTVLILFALLFLNIGFYVNKIGGIDLGIGCRWDSIIWGICFTSLCIWQAISPSKFLQISFFQYLGDRSFSIYLLHPVIIFYLDKQLINLYHSSFPFVGPYAFFVTVAFLIFIVLLISEITYRFIEIPGINLGRRMLKKPNF